MYANNLDDAFSVFASGTTEEWVKSDKYMDYPKYHDEDYTYIEGRTIGDIAAQISVQGEAYSQHISFMMDRYYDGIDLMGMSIWIHYELKDGSGSEDSPVNVMYNDSTIRFNWIVPEKATQQSGDIKIGVWVNGTAPNTKAYILKTEEKIYTIHSGLIPGSGITQPDQNWFENFVEQMDSKVSTAQGHANDAQASKTAAAGSAAASAESAAASAKALEDNKAYVESQKETFVGYNKRETDLRYANALIGSASDTTQVTVDDAWEAPILGMEIAGKSEQVVTTGAQLFDESLVPDFSTDGAQILNNGDGSFTITGSIVTTNKLFQHELTHEETVKLLKPGTIYYSNSNNENVNPKICVRFFYGATLIKDIAFGGNYEVTEDNINDENFHMRYMISAYKNLSVVPGIMKPMLYQDGDGTWEPYTGGRPSPSPEYPQEIVSTDVTAVTVTGANLFDDTTLMAYGNTTFVLSADRRQVTITGDKNYACAESDIPAQLIAGKNVTVSCNISNKNSEVPVEFQLYIEFPDGTKNYLHHKSSGSKTFSIPDNITKAIFKLFVNLKNANLDSKNTVVYSDVMVNIGTTPLPWEPYQSKTASIILAEPLRGIGDYRDEITMTNRIDRCMELTFDGSEDCWGVYTSGSRTGFSAINVLPISMNNQNGICNQALVGGNEEAERIVLGSNNQNLYYFYCPFYDATVADKGLSAWKAHLAAHPLKVVTYLDTPAETDLGADTIAALAELTTYTGRTTITVTAEGPEPDVTVEYVQDTNVVIAELKKLIEGIQNVES